MNSMCSCGQTRLKLARFTWRFLWATVYETVCPMLSDRCPVLSVLSVCDIGVLWPNGCMDQHETWHGGTPRPWPRCVRWGPSFPSQMGTAPKFSAHVYCAQNGWMYQDATWYGGRPRPKRECVRWGPSSPSPKRAGCGGGRAPQFSVHVYCGHIAGWIKVPL